MKIALSAGYDTSLPALLMAERLRAAGHQIVAVLVVSPFSLRRLRSLLRARGLAGARAAAHKLLHGRDAVAPAAGPSAVEQLAAETGLQQRSLRAWCAAHGVRRQALRSLDSAAAATALRDAGTQLLVYGGGGILRAPLIEAVGGAVLNPHAGPLPEVRGMSAIEWACLLGERRNVSVHFIDTGIDTGALIAEAPVPHAAGETVAGLRDKAVASGLRALTDLLDGVEHPGQLIARPNPAAKGDAGRQCFSLSPALQEILSEQLAATTA